MGSNDLFGAPCPRCGQRLTTSMAGTVWLMCACGWFGHLITTSGAASQGSQGSQGAQMMAPPSSTIPPPTPQPPHQAPAQDVRRDAARQRLYELAGDVADHLRSLPTDQWEAPLRQTYERLQESHARFFRALGGSRMGDYRPDPQTVRAAMRDVLLWELLAIYDAERG
jgi:hypothetical protein